MLRKLAVTLLAATALLAGTAGVASAAPAQAGLRARTDTSGLTAAQAQSLQQRVDAVLAGIPGGRQVSATTIKYDGLVVTVDPRWTGTTKSLAISCDEGWFCINVRGTAFAFYTCKTWALSNWYGSSPFNNNQTWGTIAIAYGQNGGEVWRNTAKASGSVDVGPWWSFKPC